MQDTRLPTVYLSDRDKKEFDDEWHALKGNDVATALFGLVSTLQEEQSYRSDANLVHLKLYGNKNIMSLSRRDYARTPRVRTNRLKLNLVKSISDTVAAKIGSQKPRVAFMTNDGDWDQKERAKKLQKYVDGVFKEAKIYETMPKVFLDALIFGTGFLYPYIEDDKVKVERVIPEEIIVQDADGVYGNPSQLFRVTSLPRAQLMKMFPKAKGDILFASTDTDRPNTHLGKSNDYVKVVYGWKLPSGKDAGDGVYTMCVNNRTLVNEKYAQDHFPFIVYRWSDEPLGFYGKGLSEELMDIQLEVNNILKTIQESNQLVIKPRVFIEAGSVCDASQINDLVGSIVRYSGQMPQFQTPSAIPGEYYSHLQFLIGKAYEIPGISQLSASSQMPQGIKSAVAMREFKDTASERFHLNTRRYEECFVDIARHIINLTRQLAESKEEDIVIRSTDRKSFTNLNWSEVKMDEDEFVLQAFPVSILPTEPAARLEQVMEWYSSGFISREEAMSYLGAPDTEEMVEVATAPTEVVKMQIFLILNKGRDNIQPNKYLNLNQAVQLGNFYLHRGMIDGVSEERLDLLREYIDGADALLNPPAPPPPPSLQGASPTPPMPQGTPAMPLPNGAPPAQ